MKLSPPRFLILGVLAGAMTGFADDGARHEGRNGGDGSAPGDEYATRAGKKSVQAQIVGNILDQMDNSEYYNFRGKIPQLPQNGSTKKPEPPKRSAAEYNADEEGTDEGIDSYAGRAAEPFPEPGPGGNNVFENRPAWYRDYEVDPNFKGWSDKLPWQPGSATPGSILEKAQEGLTIYAGNGGNGSQGLRPKHLQNKSYSMCYRHVKYLLKESGCVSKGSLNGRAAKIAGDDLRAQGFSEQTFSSPYVAPQGAVIVYQCGPYGHIEWKGPDGFYSDYKSERALSCAHFKVYVKSTKECGGSGVAAR